MIVGTAYQHSPTQQLMTLPCFSFSLRSLTMTRQSCLLQLEQNVVFIPVRRKEERDQKQIFFPHELRCFYCISVTETALLNIALTAKRKTSSMSVNK